MESGGAVIVGGIAVDRMVVEGVGTQRFLSRKFDDDGRTLDTEVG